MKIVMSSELMRKSEEAAFMEGSSSILLMKRAAEGIAAFVPKAERIAVITGGGNNGGDGYAASLLLQQRGMECVIIRMSEKCTPAGEHYLNACLKAGMKIIEYSENLDLMGYDVILDCIFGTGFSGIARGKYGEVIEKINDRKAYVVSADINSGLDANSGEGKLAVRSDITVAIGSLKPGHILSDAKDLMASRTVADIGIKEANEPFYLLEEEDFTDIFPARRHNSHKGTYGYCAMIGGCTNYPGAAKLAYLGEAALRSGCGVVRLAVPKSIVSSVSSCVPENTLMPMAEEMGAMLFEEEVLKALTDKVKSISVGFGWGKGVDYPKILSWLIENTEVPLIIDADGLNCLTPALCDRFAQRGNILLTPHPGEFARLTGKNTAEILSSPVSSALQFAQKYKITLLLKGSCTLITDGERVYFTETGSPGMAKGGSGDVLTGILTSLCARCSKDVPLVKIAAAGSWIAGRAGEYAARDIGEESMLPSDEVKYIPRAIKDIIRNRHLHSNL